MTAKTTFRILASTKSREEMIQELRDHSDPGTFIDDLESLDFDSVADLYAVMKDIQSDLKVAFYG